MVTLFVTTFNFNDILSLGGRIMTYEYTCTSCDHEWEAEQSIKDESLKVCPNCGKETAKRLISKSSFVLQGSGWAKDNYS